MKIELICTGEEVLSGQITDTNASWLGQYLWGKGVPLSRKNTIGDRLEDLVEIFKERSQSADLVIVNGGLGPTTDDLSTEAMAQALGVPLVCHDAWKEKLEAFFAERQLDVATCNYKQAMLPKGAILIDNPHGTACGFWVKLNRAWFFFTPGVPFEFKPMIEQHLLTMIQKHFVMPESHVMTKLLIFGIGESLLQERVKELDIPSCVTIGYRAFMPYIEFKMGAPKSKESELEQAINSVKQQLQSVIVAENKTSLAEVIHDTLLTCKKTLSVAESCTGGLLAAGLIEHAGSSAYFKEGVVAYDERSKMQRLGVQSHILQAKGAVSIEVAAQMAEGVRLKSNSDFALSTTGVAGPEGGSDYKPVGTVCIALATPGMCYVQKIVLKNRSRKVIREMSTAVSFDMLRRAINGESPTPQIGNITQSELANYRPAEVFILN